MESESDPALEIVNQKKWNQTKPIMVCNVLSFFLGVAMLLIHFFLSDPFWIILTGFFLLVLICLAIHFAWDLESRL